MLRHHQPTRTAEKQLDILLHACPQTLLDCPLVAHLQLLWNTQQGEAPTRLIGLAYLSICASATMALPNAHIVKIAAVVIRHCLDLVDQQADGEPGPVTVLVGRREGYESGRPVADIGKLKEAVLGYLLLDDVLEVGPIGILPPFVETAVGKGDEAEACLAMTGCIE